MAAAIYLFAICFMLTRPGVNPLPRDHDKVAGVPCYSDLCWPGTFCDRIVERCSQCSCEVCRFLDIPPSCKSICSELGTDRKAFELNPANIPHHQKTDASSSDAINGVHLIITVFLLLLTFVVTWLGFTIRIDLKSLASQRIGQGKYLSPGERQRPAPPSYSDIYQRPGIEADLAFSRQESVDADVNVVPIQRATSPQLDFIPVVFSQLAGEQAPRTDNSQITDTDMSVGTECVCPPPAHSVVTSSQPETPTGPLVEAGSNPLEPDPVTLEPRAQTSRHSVLSTQSDRRSINQPMITPNLCRPPDIADDETSLKMHFN